MLNLVHKDGSAPLPELLWLSCDGMMIIDEHRKILAINPALEKMIGWTSDQIVGKSECGLLFSCRDLAGCPLADQPAQCPGMKAMQEFKPVHEAEYVIRNVQGKGVVVSASYTPIQLPDRPVWAVAVLRDITEHKKQDLRWIQKAMSDPLTNLPNRTGFLENLRKELSRAQRHPRPCAVTMIDLDGFKSYNDKHGHLAGDELLSAIGSILRAGRRASDVAARYGGDEFALLLPETESAGARVVGERLCQTVAHFPFARTGPKSMAVSVGISVYPADGSDPVTLLEKADQRLYQAKKLGGNRVVGP